MHYKSATRYLGIAPLALGLAMLVLIGGCSSVGPPAADTPQLSFWHVSDRVSVDIDAFRGKVLFVNFWATWCGPCRREMPALEALQAEHSDDLVVVFLSEEPADLLRAYLAQREFRGTYGRFTPDDLVDPYSMARLQRPMTFVIDRNGVLQETIQGVRNHSFFERAFDAYR